MLAAIISLASVAYGCAGVFGARKTFGWVRSKLIAQYGVDWTEGYKGGDNKLAAFLACFFCIPLWPIYGIVFLVVVNPPKAQKELEIDNERMRRQIERMEQDAGVGPYREEGK